MLWFDGPIKNAVEKVKSSDVFLLVFVQGDDSLSRKYETYLNDEEKLKPQNFVAIKISHDSIALQQFKQIYVTVPIPSIFLIQNNGIPIKVVSTDQTCDIHNAISDVVKKQRIQNGKELKSQPDSTPLIPKKSPNEPVTDPSQHVRNIGHKLFDISEEELRKRLNAIRAFPRFLVLDQPTQALQTPPPQTVPRTQSARIQFRLPNNDTPSWEFPNLSTLGDVRAYLMEKKNLSPSFKLLRTYPRTAFTPQDEDKTLEELSLTPNATLIVVPVQDKTVQAKVKNLIVQQSFISTVVNTLLMPLFTFFKYLKKHVFRIQDGKEVGPRRLASDTDVEKILNKKTSTSNIHGFKFDEDLDTEQRDNKNSTQQRYKK